MVKTSWILLIPIRRVGWPIQIEHEDRNVRSSFCCGVPKVPERGPRGLTLGCFMLSQGLCVQGKRGQGYFLNIKASIQISRHEDIFSHQISTQ